MVMICLHAEMKNIGIFIEVTKYRYGISTGIMAYKSKHVVIKNTN